MKRDGSTHDLIKDFQPKPVVPRFAEDEVKAWTRAVLHPLGEAVVRRVPADLLLEVLEGRVVVDDEPSIRELLVASLHFAGFEVNTAASGSEAIEVIERLQPDLIVLDVMLPDIDGFTVTRRIRQEGITTPVLYLTARDDTQDKVMGLTVGGDDYVTKPFSLEEVVARIRAILRRTQQQVEDDPIIRVGDLEINEDSHDVSRAGQPIDLSPTEYKLLRYLMDNEGRVLSKAQILDHVWQYDWGGDAAIVESYISYLRKKVDGIVIEDENGDKHKVTPLIETKRGIGYMIRAPKN